MKLKLPSEYGPVLYDTGTGVDLPAMIFFFLTFALQLNSSRGSTLSDLLDKPWSEVSSPRSGSWLPSSALAFLRSGP